MLLYSLKTGKKWRRNLEPDGMFQYCNGNRWEVYRHEEAKGNLGIIIKTTRASFQWCC